MDGHALVFWRVAWELVAGSVSSFAGVGGAVGGGDEADVPVAWGAAEAGAVGDALSAAAEGVVPVGLLRQARTGSYGMGVGNDEI